MLFDLALIWAWEHRSEIVRFARNTFVPPAKKPEPVTVRRPDEAVSLRADPASSSVLR